MKPSIGNNEHGWFVERSVGKSSYLHQDGKWRSSTQNESGAYTGYFGSKAHAETLLKSTKDNKTQILDGNVQRYVHIYAPNIAKRLEGDKECELCVVRDVSSPEKTIFCKSVDILGPSSLAEINEPIPGTNGRGICPLVTEAPLVLHL